MESRAKQQESEEETGVGKRKRHVLGRAESEGEGAGLCKKYKCWVQLSKGGIFFLGGGGEESALKRLQLRLTPNNVG